MQRSMMRRLLGVLLLGGIVAVLGILVARRWEPLLSFDIAVGLALSNRDPATAYVNVLQVLTAPGLSVFRFVALAPLAVWLAVRGRARLMAFVVVTAATVGPLVTLLKEIVGRVRPTYDDPLVLATGLSYPSGHSAGAAALAGVLLVVFWPMVGRRGRPWLAAGAVALTAVVGWTRMALGVHYLSDVVGGIALGITVVLLAMVVFAIPPLTGILAPHGQSPRSAEGGRAAAGPDGRLPSPPASTP